LINDKFDEAIRTDPESFRPLWDQCQVIARILDQANLDRADNLKEIDTDAIWDHLRSPKDFLVETGELRAFAERTASEFASEQMITSLDVYQQAVEFYFVFTQTVLRVSPRIIHARLWSEEQIPPIIANRRAQCIYERLHHYVYESIWDRIVSNPADFPFCAMAFRPAIPSPHSTAEEIRDAVGEADTPATE
jgi:hypothetical protein